MARGLGGARPHHARDEPEGFDLQLTRYGGEGWRATFYPAGRAHSATRAAGSAWEAQPWHAVQQAAWETLRRADAA